MHPATKCSEDEFRRLFNTIGATETASRLGMTERNVYKRRSNLEAKYGQPINAPTTVAKQYPQRVALNIRDGHVLVGSDFHIWPGEPSTCLRAFKKFIDDIRPSAVILNGDVLDFPQISRHPPIGWESHPSVKEEIEAAQDHLDDLVKAARRARKIWTLGNHDARMEMRLATCAPEFKGMKGIHLHDHFSLWERGYSCRINENIDGDTMVKHRLGGGKNAPHGNMLKAGISIVTGHLHNQQVRTHSDYRPHDIYGMDTGCVADKDHQSFLYTEDGPLDWRSGFGLLTYRHGRLLPPELVTKWSDNEVVFRGSIQRV